MNTKRTQDHNFSSLEPFLGIFLKQECANLHSVVSMAAERENSAEKERVRKLNNMKLVIV